MKYQIRPDDKMGLIRPETDAHTLGISSLSSLLGECGIMTFTAGLDICRETAQTGQTASLPLSTQWIRANGITVIGFSYRLDPADGMRFFSRWYTIAAESGLLPSQGGLIRAVYFAGLPETCRLVRDRYPGLDGFFQGDETPAETLEILGISASRIPSSLLEETDYERNLAQFATALIKEGRYREITKHDRSYPEFGTERDTLGKRVDSAKAMGHGPLMRAHVGPYTGNADEDFALFRSWARELASGGLLDVLSIGTSQLTQSHFYEDRAGLSDGGGIAIRSPEDYRSIWADARPMLVRTYAGTRDIPRLARMHEETIHIAWHALSFWWFCRLDGRGPYPLRENLERHFETMRYIAGTGKPLEPNVPHHFAFRGADDITYIVSGFLAAKAAKLAGIRALVLQIMLNTPKNAGKIQDIAKARALCRLVRSLEDRNFKVLLQPRGGLDYFSPNLDKAKIQLATVSAMMADIADPGREGPAVIHVVSYSEAVALADPAIISESIQITRQAFGEYRREGGLEANARAQGEVSRRAEKLVSDALTVIRAIEECVPEPYTAQGFFDIFSAGFLNVPRLWECRDDFPEALRWESRILDGSVRTVNGDGTPIGVETRMELIRDRLKRKTHE